MTSNIENGKMSFKSVDHYPIAIDPSSQVISVRLTTADATHSNWKHLSRAQPSRVHGGIPTNNQRVHFFIDGESFESSQLALSYDSVGAVSGMWQLRNGRWDECVLVEEYTGQVTLSPSVRFVFANLSDRDEFVRNFNRLTSDAAAAKPVTPKHVLAMQRASGRSPTPYRIVSTLAEAAIAAVE